MSTVLKKFPYAFRIGPGSRSGGVSGFAPVMPNGELPGMQMPTDSLKILRNTLTQNTLLGKALELC